MHVGERDRIAWIVSKELDTVIVLMLGYVKDGDRGDTYPVLEKHIERGTFDECFAELRVPKPGESQPPPMPGG